MCVNTILVQYVRKKCKLDVQSAFIVLHCCIIRFRVLLSERLQNSCKLREILHSLGGNLVDFRLHQGQILIDLFLIRFVDLRQREESDHA